MHPAASEFLAKLAAIEPKPAVQPRADGPNYLIFFTARSGSSWLTELLKINGKLGNPDEWFNPGVSDGSASSFGTPNVFDYVQAAIGFARDPETGVFGAEITCGHLKVFDQIVNLFAFFPPRSTFFFYLRREDIVSQAISLYRMTSGGQAHAYATGGKQGIPYDADQIAKWLEHLRQHEIALAPILEGYGITPHCLTYEKMMACEPRQVLDFFHQRVRGRPFEGEVRKPERHSKLKAPETSKWRKRFIAERAEYLEKVNAERPSVTSDLIPEPTGYFRSFLRRA